MVKYPRHLIESFLIFATSGGTTAAAAAIGVSQPALSRQLQQFEELVGVKLFQRSGRNKTLSPLGQALVKELSASWPSFDSLIERVISQFSLAPREPIQIFGPAEILERLATRLRYDHAINYIPSRSHAVADLISGSELSLGITRNTADGYDLISRKLFEDGYEVVFPKSWRIPSSSFDKKLLQILKDMPLVLYADADPFITSAMARFQFKEPPKTSVIIPSWRALFELVALGKGWAIAPTNLIDTDERISRCPIPSQFVQKVSFYLLYKKGISRISWMKPLIEAISSDYR